MRSAISVRDLRMSFGELTVLDGLDLEVRSGEILALLGANGAGKTTAIKVLTTLLRPDSGSVEVAGVDVRREPDRAKLHFSLTGQSAAVDEALTASENLLMFGRLSGLPRRASRSRTTELLEQLDLTWAAGRRVGTFSGGMRRRLDLALSFVVTPEVLFLDEPRPAWTRPAGSSSGRSSVVWRRPARPCC